VIAAIGLAALAAYIIACTSFSPDGSKVLFPSIVPETGLLGVALYDRQTAKSEWVFVPASWRESAKEAQGKGLLRPFWSPDGQRAMVLWADADKDEDPVRLVVASLPVSAKGPVRLYALTRERGDDLGAAMFGPPCVVGKHLVLGGKSLTRLDLETGAATTTNAEAEVVLVPFGARVFFLATSPAEGVDYEVGTVDVEKLCLNPILRLQQEQVGDIFPSLPAVSRDGGKIALVSKKTKTANSVLIYRGKELEKEILLPSQPRGVVLGNLQWSADTQTIYAAYQCASEGPKPGMELGVVCIPVNAEGARFVPLCRARSGEEAIHWFQIALSPDSKTVAVSSTFLGYDTDNGVQPDNLEPEDRALFLVDVSQQPPKVTKAPIAFPGTAKPKTVPN
jgi:hypothetical protein